MSWYDPFALFAPRTEGQYGGVDRGNFNVPGATGLTQQLQGLYHGQDSMAQQRLREAQAQNAAQQQSMAAGAAPGNVAMAQLQAMQNTGRLNQGATGQATQAGIQERQAAMQGLLGLAGMQQQGGQAYEANRAARAGAQMNSPTSGEEVTGALLGGLGAASKMADGGVVTRPTHALVGEAGPEAVIPLAKLPEIMGQMRGHMLPGELAKSAPSEGGAPPPAAAPPRPSSPFYGPAPSVEQYGPPSPQPAGPSQQPWRARNPAEWSLYGQGQDWAAQRGKPAEQGMFAGGVPKHMTQGEWLAFLHGLGVQ